MNRAQLLSIFLATVAGFVFLGTSSETEAFQRTRLKLSCEHLHFIESQYLENHINYSDKDGYSRNLEKRLIDQYVKQMDRAKMYLLARDYDAIKKGMRGIYRQTKARNCAPIEKAFAIYKQRVAERVAFVEKTLTAEKEVTIKGKKTKEAVFKLDKTVEINVDPDQRKYAKTKAAQEKFHTQYLHFQVANYVVTEMSEKEAREKVIANYKRILKRVNEKEKEDIYAMFLDSFSHALDPHSSFFSWDAVEDFQIQMSLSLEGIGATLSTKDGFTTIEQLIAGGAAARSGKLKPKDKIIAVSQETDNKRKRKKDPFQKADNVVDMELRDVVRKIRGPKGSKVKLSILRKKGKESNRFEVILVRDKIKLDDEAAQVNYIDRTVKGVKKKIALINLPSFYADSRKENGRSAARDIKKLLVDVKKKKADAVVLDLSTNGGGSLDDAVKIAGLFFKTGNVVKQSQKNKQAAPIVLADLDPTVDYEGPLVILQSRISASASEIVAGTLKDYKRAIIVGGDHSFGKGSVQSVSNLPRSLGALKTTVGMFYTAGGNSTQHRGVDSDIVFPSAYSTDDLGEKNLDYSLPPTSVKKFLSKDAYVRSGPGSWEVVDKGLIKELNKKSQARISKSEDFNDVKKELEKNKARGKLIKVAELFEEEEDKDKKDGKKKDDDEAVVLTKEEKLKKYLERADIQEAVNIAADYVNLRTLNPMANTKEGKKEARNQ